MALSKDNKTKGFTLIELIIVVVLLIALAAVVSIRFTKSPNLNAQAELLANDIRYARSLSMSLGQRYRFVKLSDTSYTIKDSSNINVTMPNGNTLVTFDSSSGIKFGTISGFTNSVVFDTRGTPYADQNSTPANTTIIISLTQDGSQTASVTINPETGWISP